MADTVKVQWIYPPNWNGYLPDQGGFKRVIIHLTCQSDGTGETDAVKLRLSDLRTPSGNVPSRTALERIEYNVYGLTVLLKWDRRPHATIVVLNAATGSVSGYEVYKTGGGLVDPGESGVGDGTGDILLSTTNVDSGDSYDITMVVRLKD